VSKAPTKTTGRFQCRLCGQKHKIDLEDDGQFHVYETFPPEDEHNQHGRGDAVQAAHTYRWNAAQNAVFKTEFGKGRSFRASHYRIMLDQASLRLGCTDDDIRRKIHANAQRVQRVKGQPLGIRELRAAQRILERGGGQKGRGATGDGELYLLPLRGGQSHRLLETAVPNFADLTGQTNPKLLDDGTAYAISFPCVSVDSMQAVDAQHGRLFWFLDGVTEDGSNDV
jgi:hypothetical protein